MSHKNQFSLLLCYVFLVIQHTDNNVKKSYKTLSNIIYYTIKPSIKLHADPLRTTLYKLVSEMFATFPVAPVVVFLQFSFE